MLSSLLEQQAAKFPAKSAIIDQSKVVTYAELFRAAGILRCRLKGAGVRSNGVVAIQIPNSAEYVAALFAVWRLGATALPLDPALKAVEVASYCARAGAETVLRLDNDSVPPIGVLLESADSREYPQPPAGNDWVALMLLSSGTTGLPKFVPRTATCVHAAACLLRTGVECSADDRVLGVLPLYHSAGLFHVLLSTIERGATLYIEPFLPRQTALTIESKRITMMFASPFMYRLLSETEFATPPDFSSLRIAYTGTSALSMAVIQHFEERFGIPLTQGYGTSETHAIAVTRAGQRLSQPNLVGIPYPSITVMICDDAGNPVTPGVAGTVRVRSSAAAAEYFDDPDASATMFRDGFVITGDLGCMDESGNLFILGRKRPLLSVAGKKVAPAEIEACLRSHPDVAEAVADGVPGPDGYHRIKARVVRTGDVTAHDLRVFCAERLADFKVPRQIEFVSNLSRGPMGKPSDGSMPFELGASS